MVSVGSYWGYSMVARLRFVGVWAGFYAGMSSGLVFGWFVDS